MRISSLALLLLAGCGGATADPSALAEVESEARADAADDGRIDCAITPETELRRACLIERARTDKDELVLTIRAPDGGFRRLLVTGDGRGVVSADGAEAAAVRVVSDGEIEVALGGDRYRLPATVK